MEPIKKIENGMHKPNEIMEINKKNPSMCRPVRCRKDGEIVAEFESITHASIEMKCNLNGIWLAIKGKNKTCSGFTWEYIYPDLARKKIPPKVRKLKVYQKRLICKKYKKELTIWWGMRLRCYNQKHAAYKNYGGRGIEVCERWVDSFDNFIADMGERPSNRHTIDRVNVDGNYEPLNCKWATYLEQARNKRNNVWLEFDGRRMIIADWAKELGVKPSAFRSRQLTNGMENTYNHYKNLNDGK